jgi:hypothetical protein
MRNKTDYFQIIQTEHETIDAMVKCRFSYRVKEEFKYDAQRIANFVNSNVYSDIVRKTIERVHNDYYPTSLIISREQMSLFIESFAYNNKNIDYAHIVRQSTNDQLPMQIMVSTICLDVYVCYSDFKNLLKVI